jgi:hypothetical protein
MTSDQIVDETRKWPDEDVAELVDRIYRVRYGDAPRLSRRLGMKKFTAALPISRVAGSRAFYSRKR